MPRRKYQLTRNRVQGHNRIEALLEEAHLKLSRLVSDLLGQSARRMLAAVAEGETDPAALAALADRRLRATPEQLGDALGAATALNPVESTFATVRLRTRKTKGAGSRLACLTMVFKLAMAAQKTWRALNGCQRIAEVIDGVPFVDGVRKEAA